MVSSRISYDYNSTNYKIRTNVKEEKNERKSYLREIEVEKRS